MATLGNQGADQRTHKAENIVYLTLYRTSLLLHGLKQAHIFKQHALIEGFDNTKTVSLQIDFNILDIAIWKFKSLIVL